MKKYFTVLCYKSEEGPAFKKTKVFEANDYDHACEIGEGMLDKEFSEQVKAGYNNWTICLDSLKEEADSNSYRRLRNTLDVLTKMLDERKAEYKEVADKEEPGKLLKAYNEGAANALDFFNTMLKISLNDDDEAEFRGNETPAKQILVNRIKCKKCGDVIESRSCHDFKYCSCGAVAVDGGYDYLRRLGNPEDYEELSVSR